MYDLFQLVLKIVINFLLRIIYLNGIGFHILFKFSHGIITYH